MSRRDSFTQVAKATPFQHPDFTAKNVYDAILELAGEVASLSTPGASFGRSGNVPANSWLYRVGQIPSNKTGAPIGLISPVITTVVVGNEDVNTFDVEIYEHEGDEINLTLLTTVQMVAKRTDTFSVSVAATQGRQLSAKIVNGSAKNLGVDITLAGSSS